MGGRSFFITCGVIGTLYSPVVVDPKKVNSTLLKRHSESFDKDITFRRMEIISIIKPFNCADSLLMLRINLTLNRDIR